MSDYEFFSHNIDFLLDNADCGNEAQEIIESLACGEYEQLTDYGLTESMINDDSEMELMELLEEKAIKLSNQNN